MAASSATTTATQPLYLKRIASLPGHSERVWYLSWSPSGNTLASCSGDRTVRLWGKDGENWVCRAILDGAHERTIRRIEWSPDGTLIASASFDGTVSVWENQNGEFECIATLEGHENEVKAVAWDKDGKLLATCGRDKSVWIWELESDKEFECVAVLHSHTQDVKAVRWHPTRELLLSCSYDDTIKLWTEDEGEDWACSTTLTGHQSIVWDISVDASGEYLASASEDTSVIIWQAHRSGHAFTYKNLCTLSGYHRRAVYSVDWAAANGPLRLATAAGDDTIRIFQQDTSAADPTFVLVASKENAHESDVNCVRWNPRNPTLLASCGDDMMVNLWELTTERPLSSPTETAAKVPPLS